MTVEGKPHLTGLQRRKVDTRKISGDADRGGKSAYRVDLPAYHADCDANYLRLHKLLPALEQKDQWRYRMPHCRLDVTVMDRSRYTTEVKLSAVAEGETESSTWAVPPEIRVRLYHDARMAEVVAVDGEGHIGAKGPGEAYPNAKMQRADERQQANRFLSEWLGHCLANARSEFELILDGRRL